MTKEYTDEENRIWRASQPQKMIVSKVVIKSDKGNILLVKPDYKKTWQLPGGGVDSGESPEEAAAREVREELGFDISIDDLFIKDTIYKRDEEILLVIFENNTLISEGADFVIQEGEIANFQFVSIQEVAPLLPGYYSDFWKQNIYKIPS